MCRLETLIYAVNEDRAADKDDPTLGLILPDQPRRLDAIQTRHHDIHRHHLGAQRRGLPHRLLAVGGTAHYLNAPIGGERHLRRLDEIRVVINNENAHLRLLSSNHGLVLRAKKPIHLPTHASAPKVISRPCWALRAMTEVSLGTHDSWRLCDAGGDETRE